MKRLNFLVGLVLFIVLSVVASQSFAKKKSQLKTEFEFSGASVTGRYNSSGEGLSVVEDEKLLADLLQVRKDFKDRVKINLRDQK